MNINGHEVERRVPGGLVFIDCGESGWLGDDADDYERRADANERSALEMRLVAEFVRREAAEQEQSARDAELDRRALIARNAWFSPSGDVLAAWRQSDGRDGECWRRVVRALDADTAERGDDA